MKWTRGVLLMIAVSLAGTALGALDQIPPPGRGTPPPATPPPAAPAPQIPPTPAVPPSMAQASVAPPLGVSTPTVDVYLLAALRAQDAKIAELEKRLAVLEKKAGVSK